MHLHLQFTRGALHLLQLLHKRERRQVQHRAHANAGTDIGRAGGEVAKTRVKRIFKRALDRTVEHEHAVGQLAQLHSRRKHLQPKMVFLVHHDAG